MQRTIKWSCIIQYFFYSMLTCRCEHAVRNSREKYKKSSNSPRKAKVKCAQFSEPCAIVLPLFSDYHLPISAYTSHLPDLCSWVTHQMLQQYMAIAELLDLFLVQWESRESSMKLDTGYPSLPSVGLECLPLSVLLQWLKVGKLHSRCAPDTN